MGIFNKVSESIEAIGNTLDAVTTTDEERQAFETEMAKLQTEINKIEAQGNWFQSSWRPAVGWICVIALAYQFIISQILSMFMGYVPVAATEELYPLLFSLLGFGVYRTYEKTKGVQDQH